LEDGGSVALRNADETISRLQGAYPSFGVEPWGK
jgi:hypothetical protein